MEDKNEQINNRKSSASNPLRYRTSLARKSGRRSKVFKRLFSRHIFLGKIT